MVTEEYTDSVMVTFEGNIFSGPSLQPTKAEINSKAKKKSKRKRNVSHQAYFELLGTEFNLLTINFFQKKFKFRFLLSAHGYLMFIYLHTCTAEFFYLV